MPLMISALVLFAAAGAPAPATHDLVITQDSACGSCGSVIRTEGVAFEQADRRLALFADFAAGGDRVGMLEISGVGFDRTEPVVRYNEVDGGRVVFQGRIENASFGLRRVSTRESWITGSLSFDAVDPSGEMRVFRNIEITPPRSDTGGGGSGGGSVGGGGGSSVVVVTETNYGYGCGSGYSSSSGGCDEDYSDSGGCDDSSSSSSGGGCEGDTSSDAGCDGGGSSGCEGDYRSASVVGGLWRLLWPIITVGLWNRARRFRS